MSENKFLAEENPQLDTTFWYGFIQKEVVLLNIFLQLEVVLVCHLFSWLISFSLSRVIDKCEDICYAGD